MSTIDEHDQPAAEAIARELVACTLGQRQRPELRVDVAGAMHRLGVRIEAQADAFRQALAGVGRAVAAIRPDLDRIRREDLQP